jgi:hypothetical protein
MARARGAWVVFGGIHATLFPDEAHEQGGTHAVVRGGWRCDLAARRRGLSLRETAGCLRTRRIEADGFASARWHLLPRRSLHVVTGLKDVYKGSIWPETWRSLECDRTWSIPSRTAVPAHSP